MAHTQRAINSVELLEFMDWKKQIKMLITSDGAAAELSLTLSLCM